MKEQLRNLQDPIPPIQKTNLTRKGRFFAPLAKAALFFAVAGGLTFYGLGLRSAQAQGQAREQVMKGFKVPDYNEDGSMKSMLHAKVARGTVGKPFEIEGLQIDFYRKEKIEMRVTSPFCHYNEKSGQAFSEDNVRISREQMEVTGKGFTWDPKKEQFQIKNNAKVILKNAKMEVPTKETNP